jgi:Tfp pilus assembly protein PilO
MDKLPRWSLWAAAALLFWTAWVLLLGRPLMHKVTELEGEYREIESELASLEARMSAVPNLVLRLNEARHQRDSTLAGFSTNHEIDTLLCELRTRGGRRGLGDLRIDPELMSLLHVPMTANMPGSANGQLDTVIVNLSATGKFKNIGTWLDDIEGRSDFRFWTMCNWSVRNEDGRVGIEAQAVLVVVKEPDPVPDLITMGSPQ